MPTLSHKCYEMKTLVKNEGTPCKSNFGFIPHLEAMKAERKLRKPKMREEGCERRKETPVQFTILPLPCYSHTSMSLKLLALTQLIISFVRKDMFSPKILSYIIKKGWI
uniref:Uncharacterized protein n=1 Tax=Rhizophora mucronata TaxID=61149 RepID=A0A2P2P1J4_RHIMU